MAEISVGANAPQFSLPDQNGEVVSLSDFSDKWLVLYFYPKDGTSGCTKEAQDFSSLKAEFNQLGCEICGVSPDSVESHIRFIKKFNLAITLLSDQEKSSLVAYGAWGLKKNYGREYMGVIRSTVIIDPCGVVREIWRKVRVRQKTKTCEILHAYKVLQKLKELQADS